jgi:hypothetical protein
MLWADGSEVIMLSMDIYPTRAGLSLQRASRTSWLAEMGADQGEFWKKTLKATEMSPKQTSAEIQTQKNLADQSLLPGVPDESKTPLKLFEKYFAAVARMCASEFDCFTKRGIKDYFDETGDLTEEARKRIADGAKESGTGGHKLVGFWYYADSDKPSIVFGFMYFQKGKTSEPVWSHEEVKLNLIKTEQGWRIDKWTELKAR